MAIFDFIKQDRLNDLELKVQIFSNKSRCLNRKFNFVQQRKEDVQMQT